MKAFNKFNFFAAALICTASFAIANSVISNNEDPNLSESTKNTESDICVNCSAKAIDYTLSPKVLSAILAAENSTKTAAQMIKEKEEPKEHVFIEIDPNSFNKETARLLTEKVKERNVSQGSVVRIVFRNDIKRESDAIKKQIREAFADQFKDSAKDTQLVNNEDGTFSVPLANNVKLSGKRVNFQLLSLKDIDTRTELKTVFNDGKPRLEGSHVTYVDKNSNFRMSVVVGGKYTDLDTGKTGTNKAVKFTYEKRFY